MNSKYFEKLINKEKIELQIVSIEDVKIGFMKNIRLLDHQLRLLMNDEIIKYKLVTV